MIGFSSHVCICWGDESRKMVHSETNKVMFGLQKMQGKEKEKKIKIELSLTCYFYLLLQTNFIYFNSSI